MAYIPASTVNTDLDVQGNVLANKGRVKYNTELNTEQTGAYHPVCPELYAHENTMAIKLRYGETLGIVTSKLYLFDDIKANREDKNSEFALIEGGVKSKHTTYSEALTGDCLAKANEYFKTI